MKSRMKIESGLRKHALAPTHSRPAEPQRLWLHAPSPYEMPPAYAREIPAEVEEEESRVIEISMI